MGQEHAPETVWKAQELYCVDCLSFDKVASILGVAASTLKRWSEKYGWREKREEIAQAEAEIRADKVLARSKTIKALLETPRADMAFAVSALENLSLKEAEAAMRGREVQQQEQQASQLQIETKADAIRSLRLAIENKLNLLLTSPQAVDLKSVKDVAACMELLETLEAALPQEDSGKTKAGIDEKMAASLRKALGLVQ